MRKRLFEISLRALVLGRIDCAVWCLAISPMLLAPCFSAQAQQAGKMVRIGYLDQSNATASAVHINVFMQELRTLGWTEGRNFMMAFKFTEGGGDRLPAAAAELVRFKVDLIVVSETTPALAAKRATTNIPILFTNVGDPVVAGLVASLARPGGNLTGFASLSTQLNTKRLEILKDAVPKLARVGFLRLADSGSGSTLQVKELRSAAEALKLTLEEFEILFDGKGLEDAFQNAKKKQVTGIMHATNNRFLAQRKRIVELAETHRLPAIYPQDEFVEAGGLMSYGADYDDLYRKAAHYADRILKGTKPADLPVQQPIKFDFIINLKAAKPIGLTLAPEFLSLANRVIR